MIDSKLARAATERDRRLAEVERDQNKIIQTKRAELETALATAVADQTQTRREVDTYKIEKLGAGQAALSGARRPRSSSRASSTPSTRPARPRSTPSAPSRSSA